MEKNGEKDLFLYLFMSKLKRFEDLEVRNLWMEMTTILSKIFYDSSFRNFSFQDQIMRACISITNNIAEWFESGSKKEFIKFLYYSKRSAWEVRSMFYIAKQLNYISEEEFEIFHKKIITLSVKLYNLITSISK